MRYKKIVAVSLAVTMAFGSSAVAFADEVTTGTGSTTGNGKLEGTVDTDVFRIDVPTIPVSGASSLEFILDPEGLIDKTSQAAYSGKTFESGATLFFQNAAGGASDFSATSDKMTITNMSSNKVDITLSAKITDADGVNLTDDKTFADDTKPSMYLAIKTDAEETPIVTAGATVSDEIEVSTDAAANYEYKYTAGTGYTYELVSGKTATDFADAKFDFQLTGAANAAGDWSALANVKPAVEVTWNVALHSDGYVSSKTVSAVNRGVVVTLPEGVSISGIKIIKADGSEIICKSGTHYTVSGVTVNFVATVLSNNVGGTVEIAYSDSHTDKLMIQ